MSGGLSETQRAILAFLAEGHAPFLHHYNGPPGAEGGRQSGYYWRQYRRAKTPPRVPGSSVNGLIRRNLLQFDGDGDYRITEAGRVAVSRAAD